MNDTCDIRDTAKEDLDDVLEIERLAFDGNEEASLVADLLQDPTADPVVSLLAFIGNEPVGHILFSRVYFEDSQESPMMHILAPLAVKPDWQGRGVGGKLIKAGISKLKEIGSSLLFVLGYPDYYSKHGFIPDAAKMGYETPYPLLEHQYDAWMVQSLTSEPPKYMGRIRCAKMLDKPEYWTE
jgi:putative acetyltransferase